MLPKTAEAELVGKRAGEMVKALEQVVASDPIRAFGDMTFLRWLADRWLNWVNATPQTLDADLLLSDLGFICSHMHSRIKGMGLSHAANFLADLGLHAFGAPGRHVTPIMNMLTLQSGGESAFRALVKIARAEDEVLSHNRRFDWLREAGGLKPRFLDRVIYLIGSDKFGAVVRANETEALGRRDLMVSALISAGLVTSRYSSASRPILGSR
jgi:hypothetical protein